VPVSVVGATVGVGVAVLAGVGATVGVAVLATVGATVGAGVAVGIGVVLGTGVVHPVVGALILVVPVYTLPSMVIEPMTLYAYAELDTQFLENTTDIYHPLKVDLFTTIKINTLYAKTTLKIRFFPIVDKKISYFKNLYIKVSTMLKKIKLKFTK